MGCTTHKPQREELLKYFWASLPIRRMLARHVKNCVKIYNREENEDDEFQHFQEFFMTDDYLLFGNEQMRKVCRTIFEKEATRKNYSHFLFCIVLLSQWYKELKHEEYNVIYILRFNEYLKLNLLKYNEATHEWYFTYDDLFIIMKRFIEMTTVNSVKHVLTLSDGDDKRALLNELKNRYSVDRIDQMIRDKLAKRPDRITVLNFVQNDLDWLTRDDSPRQTLLARETELYKTSLKTGVENSMTTTRVETKSTSNSENNQGVKKTVIKKRTIKSPAETKTETRIETSNSQGSQLGGGFGFGALKTVYEKHEAAELN
jgi:hypothetical protein